MKLLHVRVFLYEVTVQALTHSALCRYREQENNKSRNVSSNRKCLTLSFICISIVIVS